MCFLTAIYVLFVTKHTKQTILIITIWTNNSLTHFCTWKENLWHCKITDRLTFFYLHYQSPSSRHPCIRTQSVEVRTSDVVRTQMGHFIQVHIIIKLESAKNNNTAITFCLHKLFLKKRWKFALHL